MAVQYPIRCFFSVASAPGTGAIPVGTALPAYVTPKSQNYTSGAKLPYVAIDGSNFEAGIGVYTNNNGVESISRGLRFSTSGALINLTASAQVMITPAMQDQITANNAANADGADHFIKIGWNGSRLVFDLDNAGTVGILLSDADLTSITSQFAGVQTILAQLNRAVTVLDLLRSVSAVALNAVGFLDDYADLSGVDSANSTGVTLLAAGDVSNSSSRPWVPTDLGSALLFWIDPTDATSYTLSGTAIANIKDKVSGTGLTATSGPTIARAGSGYLKNQPVIQVSGGSYLSQAAQASLPSGTTEGWLFSVINPYGQGTGYAPAALGYGNVRSLGVNGSSQGPVGAPSSLYSTTSFSINGSGLASDTGQNVLLANDIYPGASTAGQTIWQNGTQLATGSATSSGANGTLYIGCRPQSPTEYLNAYLGDQIITGVLTVAQRQQLEGYLANKYGLVLPTSHPYYSAPPTVAAGLQAMSLRSVRATLKYTPQRVYYSGVLKMAGGVINTDVKASVTRDGATYTAGTLVQLFTRSDGASIYELQDASGKPGVDVTGQPSGQAVGYKLDATAAYRQDAYAADLRAA